MKLLLKLNFFVWGVNRLFVGWVRTLKLWALVLVEASVCTAWAGAATTGDRAAATAVIVVNLFSFMWGT